MKTKIFVLSLSLTMILPLSFSSEVFAFDAGLYDKILKKYVYNKRLGGIKMNVVDYSGLLMEKGNPNSDYARLLKKIEDFNPEGLPVDAQIAFWINVYNIGAINLILKYYPVDSIRNIRINILKNPWNKQVIRVNGKDYSLAFIEHGILLGRYKKKMIHFGIVCASISCPELSRTVYTGVNLNRVLNRQARIFLQNKEKGIRVDRGNKRVYVSKIFKFDAKSFSRGKADIIPFVLPFVDNPDREYLKKGDYELKFLPYNWDLNDLKKAQ
jgi:hypothetical protein